MAAGCADRSHTLSAVHPSRPGSDWLSLLRHHLCHVCSDDQLWSGGTLPLSGGVWGAVSYQGVVVSVQGLNATYSLFQLIIHFLFLFLLYYTLYRCTLTLPRLMAVWPVALPSASCWMGWWMLDWWGTGHWDSCEPLLVHARPLCHHTRLQYTSVGLTTYTASTLSAAEYAVSPPLVLHASQTVFYQNCFAYSTTDWLLCSPTYQYSTLTSWDSFQRCKHTHTHTHTHTHHTHTHTPHTGPSTSPVS